MILEKYIYLMSLKNFNLSDTGVTSRSDSDVPKLLKRD